MRTGLSEENRLVERVHRGELAPSEQPPRQRLRSAPAPQLLRLLGGCLAALGRAGFCGEGRGGSCPLATVATAPCARAILLHIRSLTASKLADPTAFDPQASSRRQRTLKEG